MSVDILTKVFFSAIAVAVVFVCEAGWPLAKAAVRNWIDMVRQAKAAAEEDEKLKVEEENEKVEDRRAREGSVPKAAKRTSVSRSAGEKQSVPQEGVPQEQPRNAVPEVAAKSAPVGAQKDAETSWESIQQMPHNFIPDPDEDYEYLHRMNDAAKSGCVEAMFKLAEYARRRNADVESYYWLKMAKIHGATGVDEALKYCLRQWRVNGFNPEYENEYVFFTERQGVLGRAALRLDSGVDATMARARLRDMIATGDQEAKLFSEHCGG